jgi:NADH-quinone oxidoreductase subunit J
MITFAILALLIVAGAVAAVSLRNLVHCALALTVTFAALAALYLQLDAQFVGFAQVLVYIGAVAILIVFAILLTRGSAPAGERIFSSTWFWGIGVVAGVFLVLSIMLLSSPALRYREVPAARSPSVAQIGDQLMTRYIVPLEVLGLLLTAALLGAVLLAMRESEPEPGGAAAEVQGAEGEQGGALQRPAQLVKPATHHAGVSS